MHIGSDGHTPAIPSHMLYKLYGKLNKDILGILAVLAVATVVCVISVRINIFRYNNFDFGKFDLGNMTQMVWNTMHGRFMYLTDYFGANVPRWSMSHVDPILVLFVPLFALIPHPLTLVFAQLFLTTILAPLILFKIAKMNLKSDLAATLISIAYLFYPALGYLNTQTGFHGVSAAIPFFLLAAYFIEKIYRSQNTSKWRYVGLWVSSLIVLSGKEQLTLYIILLCVFALIYRLPKSKNLIALLAVSLAWFVLTFFVIIPSNAHYRIESYAAFTKEVGVDTTLTSDVIKPNYFLGRYDKFGDSYSDIVLGMLSQPKRLVNVFFAGDKLDNFNKTFAPTLFLPFLAPQILAAAIPDLVINFGTTAGGIGTSEISNHRISMIIPVVFLATVFAVASLSKYIMTVYGWVAGFFYHAPIPLKRLLNICGFANYPKIQGVIKRTPPPAPPSNNIKIIAIYILATTVLISNMVATFRYNNPVFLWLTQAVSKKLASVAYAKVDREVGFKQDLKLGEIFKISGLENKDRECAQKIMEMIPAGASISGPDYLGTHLAQRETYAIFPALYSKADYVIVDVFSQKIMRILDSDISLVRDVVGDMINNPDYVNIVGCGNLFVFKKAPTQIKSSKLPIQERYNYPKDQHLEIFQGLFLADFELPTIVTRGVTSQAQFVYIKKSDKLIDNVIFTSFINNETGEIYQSANIPSYGLLSMNDWTQDRYYVEDVELILPIAITPGKYHAFVGITNNIKTRSMYLGDVEVK